MSNIPIVDVAAQLNRMEERILRELRDLRAELTRENRNNFVRMINSKVTSDTTALEELLGQDGQPIQNFPETSAHIHAMDSVAVNNLLVALGLPVGGRVDVRKNRIRRHIGPLFDTQRDSLPHIIKIGLLTRRVFTTSLKKSTDKPSGIGEGSHGHYQLARSVSERGNDTVIMNMQYEFLNKKLDSMELHLNDKFNSMVKRFESIDKRFDGVEARFNGRVEALDRKMTTLFLALGALVLATTAWVRFFVFHQVACLPNRPLEL
ncbi:uncharacterized protein LAJ45_09579 [Morchella importuna]|uniref:uncharacterized protein n=1 Tax=Morchella importuna TaxID=1174673 RepID=UPI001E8CA948|nr:uncharacterized protein LAJ45_09579 [Morchella importuna]KAH8146386.1 hypothetical protein LAJ45_09579 [Morchella importuna]